MTEEMFTLIKKELSQDTVEKVESKKATWLIFTIGKNKFYALPAGMVKEILRDTPIFSLPFVPEYLKGVVNRYGDPYAVIDPAMLINEEPQSTSLFIVLNSDSHTCFQISDVKDFYITDENDVIHFAQAEMADYFDGTITFNNETVLILKPETFLERVGNDIV